MAAIEKGHNNKLPGLESVFKISWKITPRINHRKLRESFNDKITKLFSRIGELFLKKGLSSQEVDELSAVTSEEQFPQEKELSLEDGIPSEEVNEPYLAEIEEQLADSEEFSSEIGIPSQKDDELSTEMIEEISLEGDGLCEEHSTVTTPQPSISNGEQRKVSVNTSSVSKYFFLLEQGVQLTDAAKELSDEKMDFLWEDIFKPLDFYSILHERRKQLTFSEIETNMQNLL